MNEHFELTNHLILWNSIILLFISNKSDLSPTEIPRIKSLWFVHQISFCNRSLRTCSITNILFNVRRLLLMDTFNCKKSDQQPWFRMVSKRKGVPLRWKKHVRILFSICTVWLWYMPAIFPNHLLLSFWRTNHDKNYIVQ